MLPFCTVTVIHGQQSHNAHGPFPSACRPTAPNLPHTVLNPTAAFSYFAEAVFLLLPATPVPWPTTSPPVFPVWPPELPKGGRKPNISSTFRLWPVRQPLQTANYSFWRGIRYLVCCLAVWEVAGLPTQPLKSTFCYFFLFVFYLNAYKLQHLRN